MSVGFAMENHLLFVFVFVGMFSPGPNVIMLTVSGARFGLWRTAPHLMGVVVGVGVIAAAASAGIGALLLAYPELRLTLKILAALWIFWMAWKMLRSARMAGGHSADKPFGFVNAVLFQWVNPKTWAVALAASAGYGSSLPLHLEVMRMAATFSTINFGVALFWTLAGVGVGKLLSTSRAWNAFMTVMAVLLGLSGFLVFL